MSTIRKSRESQNTSLRNCSTALCSIGPLQMTALSSPTKKSIDMTFTRWATGGTIMSPTMIGGLSTPSIAGIENPQMSPSTIPTRFPCLANATARLAETEDLPTPPLPDEIAIVRVAEPGSPIPGPALSLSPSIHSVTASSSMTSTLTSAPPANGAKASWSLSLSASGGPVGRRSSTRTLPASFLLTPFTSPRSPRVRPTRSGDSMDATAASSCV